MHAHSLLTPRDNSASFTNAQSLFAGTLSFHGTNTFRAMLREVTAPKSSNAGTYAGNTPGPARC